MRPAGIVFDLDGTLVDSRLDLAAGINATRERLGLAPLPMEAIAAMVGEGARTLLRRALPDAIDGAAFDEALSLFLDLYYDRCLDSTRAYPGIPELLAALSPHFPLAVLTNKPERHSRRILDGLGLSSRFQWLVGGDTLAMRKPEPGGLLHIAAQWDTLPSQLLLVGDSDIDVATARAAGSALAVVAWGFGALDRSGADAANAWQLDSPADLLARLHLT
ncbi:MAG TPA: HAD-IA family hydrolase [Thermoanaerobaculia bacterium]|jgi:phosphoglycolate phosphatase|nr:HAD-IA family hydrolase [Thermoanaerobaculia bacterium]